MKLVAVLHVPQPCVFRRLRTVKVLDAMRDIGGCRRRLGLARILHDIQHRPGLMFGPDIHGVGGAFDAARARQVQKLALPRHACIEAILTGKADTVRYAVQLFVDAYAVLRFGPNHVELAQQAHIMTVEPLGIRQGDVVTRLIEVLWPNMLEHYIQIEALWHALRSHTSPPTLRTYEPATPCFATPTLMAIGQCGSYDIAAVGIHCLSKQPKIA